MIIELNNNRYKEKYIQGCYMLYSLEDDLLASTSNNIGLYLKGNRKDIVLWFHSLNVNRVVI